MGAKREGESFRVQRSGIFPGRYYPGEEVIGIDADPSGQVRGREGLRQKKKVIELPDRWSEGRESKKS